MSYYSRTKIRILVPNGLKDDSLMGSLFMVKSNVQASYNFQLLLS